MKIVLSLRTSAVGGLVEYEAEVDEADAKEAETNFYNMYREPHTNSKGKWATQLREAGYGRLVLKQKPMTGKPNGGALEFNMKSVLYTRRKESNETGK